MHAQWQWPTARPRMVSVVAGVVGGRRRGRGAGGPRRTKARWWWTARGTAAARRTRTRSGCHAPQTASTRSTGCQARRDRRACSIDSRGAGEEGYGSTPSVAVESVRHALDGGDWHLGTQAPRIVVLRSAGPRQLDGEKFVGIRHAPAIHVPQGRALSEDTYA